MRVKQLWLGFCIEQNGSHSRKKGDWSKGKVINETGKMKNANKSVILIFGKHPLSELKKYKYRDEQTIEKKQE